MHGSICNIRSTYYGIHSGYLLYRQNTSGIHSEYLLYRQNTSGIHSGYLLQYIGKIQAEYTRNTYYTGKIQAEYTRNTYYTGKIQAEYTKLRLGLGYQYYSSEKCIPNIFRILYVYFVIWPAFSKITRPYSGCATYPIPQVLVIHLTTFSPSMT